jgi:hypothetical protein
MKKLLIPLCLIISFHLTAQEDDGYVMYQTIQLKAKSGHQMDLREGLKAHNEKFHTGGSEAVSVWNIRSGPNATGISWVKGPMTWSSLDTPLTEDHRADWQKNVAAHADVGEFGYWRLVDGMTYAPEGFKANVMRIRWFAVKPGKADDAREIFERIFEVFRQNNLDMGLHVYSNETPGADGPNLGILWQHDSWASMDRDRDWVAKYEAIHGKDSWGEYFRDWREAVTFTGTQLNSLAPALSTPDE